MEDKNASTIDAVVNEETGKVEEVKKENPIKKKWDSLPKPAKVVTKVAVGGLAVGALAFVLKKVLGGDIPYDEFVDDTDDDDSDDSNDVTVTTI